MLPPRIAAEVDRLRPAVGEGFGPFNGQTRRQTVLEFSSVHVRSTL